jgi:hypothetical protein
VIDFTDSVCPNFRTLARALTRAKAEQRESGLRDTLSPIYGTTEERSRRLFKKTVQQGRSR